MGGGDIGGGGAIGGGVRGGDMGGGGGDALELRLPNSSLNNASKIFIARSVSLRFVVLA
jgi:hypothetical protein